MAQIQHILHINIDPAKPVQEICAVITAITPYHPADQEQVILQGVAEAIQNRLTELKGAENRNEQVREPGRNEENKG